jgi:UDP-glucose 4-epimerase
MTKILVTGGSGFVGNALLKHSSFSSALVIGRTKPSSDNDYVKISLDAATDYSVLLKGVDVIIHLAARAHVMDDKSNNPLEEFRFINTHATLNLAAQAAKIGVKRFIFVSTAKVLGEKTSQSIRFTAFDSLCPQDPYSVSKAEAEMGLQKIAQESSMDLVIIRPPLVYGPEVKGNFEKLIRLISLKVPLPLESINNRRSMVSVDNLVDLIAKCITAKNAENQVFMVSDDHDLSTPELIRMICRSKGINSKMFSFPPILLELFLKCLGKGQVYERLCGSMQVDITHTKTQMKWEPITSPEKSFLMYFRK